MIEIKPSRQSVRPKTPKRKTKSYMRENMEYIKNQAKWSAAMEYCENNNMKFKIITEKELGTRWSAFVHAMHCWFVWQPDRSDVQCWYMF